MQTTDPGYAFLNWTSALVDGGVYLVNFVCAILIVWCLISFSRRETASWLFVSASVLFYIIIIGMSLTRQAVALGFELMAIRAVLDKRWRYFVFCIVCATSFHISALVLFPLYMLVNSQRKLTYLASLFVSIVIGAGLVALELFESFYYYIDQSVESEGTFFRSIYLAVPGLLFLFYRRKLPLSEAENKLWTVFAVLCVGSLVVGYSALTAVDRLLIYLIPFPPMVYGRLMALWNGPILKICYGMGVIVFHATLLYVWLHYSNNSIAWIPYRSVLID
jgi:hypothetical protein